MTAPAPTDLLPLEPEAPAARLIRAAVPWANDKTCSLALAELDDAVEAYQGHPLGSEEDAPDLPPLRRGVAP
ncbi:hypothetical protein DK419_13465 [Methylobacterium terrae]|uniref:Uncharacterized protein n=1 Tax=Methylobacterium terrae TaxID=2202827 RepID=A0A2U8WNV3_9HYPH|nr:hypothetical protein [Methylobacterium terrae]AWN47201.1 hypothetical protein DK419_13465 [Methylobacterium terrae]